MVPLSISTVFLLVFCQPVAEGTLSVSSVTLMNAAKSGVKMPVVGIGTWSYGRPGEVWNDTVAEKAISEWLMLGGRRIDGAILYGDQVGVGKGIKSSGVPRTEIFMTSKIEIEGYNETLTEMKQLLADLQMDYVDLLLIHWPGPRGSSTDPACQRDPPTWRSCRQSVWKAMEKLFNSGKALAIGVSNFEQNHLEDIIQMSSMIPSVNQVEFQPYWHEDDLLAYCKSKNITFNSYSPLGAPDWGPTQHGWNGTILALPVIQSIAKAHQRTAAQIIQRWQWQQGIVVNPRTLNQNHMKENLNLFDFELSDDEMKQISSIKPPSDPKVCPDPHNIK